MVTSWQEKGGDRGKGAGIKRYKFGRYRIDRGRLRTVQKMEKPKNLYA